MTDETTETAPAPAVPSADEIAAAKKKSDDEAAASMRKAREDAINDRVAELKNSEGKWYARNDGTGMPTIVRKYAGIHVIGGVATYIFSVEIPGHAAWNPSATDFLAEHTLIVPQPETKPTAAALPH